MALDVSLYKKRVLLLAQTFFIKDNRAGLLQCAHRYDFDIQFFDQMRAFVAAAKEADPACLFVVDLDVLANIQHELQHQRKKTLMLSDLLEALPSEHHYVYLQTERQGVRFLLQQMLVDHNCLAYAQKPIANDVLVDKLFNLFARQKRSEVSRVVYLGVGEHFDIEMLRENRVEFVRHTDATTLHRLVKQIQPDIVVIEQVEYTGTEAIARVISKNIEADPGREIILLLRQHDAELERRAFGSGFDDVLQVNDSGVLTRHLLNRIGKIRVSKDLISRDRATGLLNKIGLQQRAQDLIRLATQEVPVRPMAFGVIDIDKFKTINDTWGHYFGDIVIKRLSMVLSNMVGEQDLLSRFGGEEFVCLFWDCTLEQGKQKLDQMREAFGEIAFEVAPGEIKHFSFSGGVAAYPEYTTENELFLRADAKLYEAKQGGRNQICI
ncbi:MAG: hypothetical protein RL748_3018 [Pseudomonadota bacterium]